MKKEEKAKFLSRLAFQAGTLLATKRLKLEVGAKLHQVQVLMGMRLEPLHVTSCLPLALTAGPSCTALDLYLMC